MINKSLTLKAASVLQEIEELSHKIFLPIIGPVKGEFLVETVRKYKVKKILEIGTLIGYSAILMAGNLVSEGQIYTIEINPHSAEIARGNVSRAGLSDKIKIFIGDALEIIPTLDEEFDMAFIDAEKSEYYQYLKLIEPKLGKNGIVFADNVKIFAHQMPDYLSHVRNSGKYASHYYDAGFDGVEVSLKL